MNRLLGLKLLLIRHGKCSACKDSLQVKHCEVYFNTRLEPEVCELTATGEERHAPK